MRKDKVLVALSGGVDSTVSAALLCESGYDCIGAMMSLFPDTACEDARAAAKTLGIPFDVCDFSECFRLCVIDPFVDAYRHGRTPNPCITCNRRLKFGRLLEWAREEGCSRLATGHYARVEQDPDTGRFLLKKALDIAKDQSYVLYSLTQDQLAHVLFPLGAMYKTQVRSYAAEHGLANADRPESQDICFISDGDYGSFIESDIGVRFPEGNFIDAEGNVLGRHRGIIRYTVGQRKGLGIAFGEPRYVLRIDPEANTVTLGTNAELFSDALTAANLNLISCGRIETPMRVKAKIRYRHPEQWATVTQPDENTIRVIFDEPQRAITPGQAVVLYDKDVVVGGGTICGCQLMSGG